MSKKIIVTIDPAGSPTIEAEGFVGNSCQAATKSIEDAFKGGDFDVEFKPEFNQIDTEEEQEIHL